MRKGIVIICICLFIMLLCVGVCACEGRETAAEQFSFSLQSDDTYTISAARQDLPAKIVIPESYQDKPVTRIKPYAFQNCLTIEEVVVPNSVTQIGFSAFKGCSSLQEIEIPFVGGSKEYSELEGFFGFIFGGTKGDNSVVPPSLKTVVVTGGSSIQTESFAFCQNITSVTIPDAVTRIETNAFMYCRALTEVNLPNSLTELGLGAFRECNSIRSIRIPGGVSEIKENTFENCSSLTSAVIEEGVTSIDRMAFCGCSSMTLLSLPNTLTRIGNKAFCDCGSLEDISFPNSLTSIGAGAFSGCSTLTSVTLGTNVTSIGRAAFASCALLEEMTIPFIGETKKRNDVEDGTQHPFAHLFGTSKFTDGYYVWQKYYYRSDGFDKSVDLSAYIPWSLSRVTVLGGDLPYQAFYECGGVTSVILGEDVRIIGKDAFNSSGVTDIILPDSVVTIEDKAFELALKLESLSIGKGVSRIGKDAFLWTGSLKSIMVSEGNAVYHSQGNCLIETESKTIIRGCGNAIPSDGSVTRIANNAFEFWDGSDPLTIPDTITSIGAEAFKGATFTEMTLPNSVAEIGSGIFSGCSFLERLTVPFIGATKDDTETAFLSYFFGANSWSKSYAVVPSLKEVNVTGKTRISEYAFYHCSNLTRVIATECLGVGASTFDGCTALEEVIIGNSSANEVTSFYAKFKDCTSLRSLSIKGIKYIGSDVCCNCSSLTALTLGSELKSIGSYSFGGCFGLTSIYYAGTGTEWDAVTKNSAFENPTYYFASNCKIYCLGDDEQEG